MKTLNKRSGFSVVEALLILMVLGVIGFTGWFVYHSKQATEKTLSDTGNSSISKASIPTTTKDDAQRYLVIKEWNVELPLSATILDAYYIVNTDSNSQYSSMYIGTRSLTALDPNCAADGSAFGTIGRETAEVHNANAARSVDYSNPVYSIKLGSYYYGYNQPQAACSDKDSPNLKQQSNTEAFRNAITGIKATN